MAEAHARPFSLTIYLALVLALSWPFQFAFLYLGPGSYRILLGTMIMAGVATFIAGKYVFKDGFQEAGWSVGNLRSYVLALAIAVGFWVVPSLIEHYAGIHPWVDGVSIGDVLLAFLVGFAVLLIPALGEEFSWRGYLLPRLLDRHTPRKALLIHGVITWAWHLPTIVAFALDTPGSALVVVPASLVIGFVPTVLHAVVFAYLWATSRSLLVAVVYHALFDEIRDALRDTVGLGVFTEIWQPITAILLGGWFLYRAPRWIHRREGSHATPT